MTRQRKVQNPGVLDLFACWGVVWCQSVFLIPNTSEKLKTQAAAGFKDALDRPRPVRRKVGVFDSEEFEQCLTGQACFFEFR